MPNDGGWILPTVVDPDDKTAVCICIPNEENHIMAFWGALRELAYWFNWQRDDAHTGLPVSIVWRAIVDTAHEKWLEGVMCGSCDELAECIESSEAVQNAINALITKYNKEHGAPGNLMPPGDRAANWGGSFNGTCDLDIVWPESVAVVERCNATIMDLLESLAEADTIAKGVGVLANIPVIENLGIETLTDLASLVTQIALTSYTDAYTLAWAEELECAIFCAAKDDCIVNFDKVFGIIRPRIENEIVGFVPPGNILDMTGWATQIATFVVQLLELNKADLLFYLIFGGLAYGNVILNQNGIGAGILKIAVILASDEPSNDWEVLCGDCTEPVIITFDPQPYVPADGLVLDTDGGQFGSGDARWLYTPFIVTITLPDPERHIVKANIVAAFALETGNTVTINGENYDLVRGHHYGGDTYDYDATIPNIFSDTVVFNMQATIALSSVNISVLPL